MNNKFATIATTAVITFLLTIGGIYVTNPALFQGRLVDEEATGVQPKAQSKCIKVGVLSDEATGKDTTKDNGNGEKKPNTLSICPDDFPFQDTVYMGFFGITGEKYYFEVNNTTGESTLLDSDLQPVIIPEGE